MTDRSHSWTSRIAKSMIKIRIEEFYTELNENEQSTTIHTDPKGVPGITSWEWKQHYEK